MSRRPPELAGSANLLDRRLQALFEYSRDGILLANDEGRYVEANPAACELFALDRDTLLQKDVVDVSGHLDPETVRAAWRSFLEAGELAGQWTIVRADGVRRTVEFRAVARVLPGTHLSIMRDVTERQAADEARQRDAQRLRLLAAIDHAILSARSPEHIARAAVEQVAQLMPAVRVSVIVLREGDEVAADLLAVWSSRPTQLTAGRRLPAREAIGDPLGSLQPANVEDLMQLPQRTPFEEALALEGIRSFVRVPLEALGEQLGILRISSDRPHTYTDDDLVVATEVANSLAVAIRNARLLEGLQRSTASLAAMSKRVVELRERERRDIARELHDEIGQVLTALRFQLDAIREAAPPAVAGAVAQTERLADDLVATVRRLTFDLRPPLLDEFGLRRALRAHFERFTGETGVTVLFIEGDAGKLRLPLGVESAAFRIVQESLTNVARHADVDSTRVELAISPGQLRVNVHDRGRGFDAGREPWGSGITGMNERVTLLGGSFRVTSSPGQGTSITAIIPLSDEDRR